MFTVKYCILHFWTTVAPSLMFLRHARTVTTDSELQAPVVWRSYRLQRSVRGQSQSSVATSWPLRIGPKERIASLKVMPSIWHNKNATASSASDAVQVTCCKWRSESEDDQWHQVQSHCLIWRITQCHQRGHKLRSVNSDKNATRVYVTCRASDAVQVT